MAFEEDIYALTNSIEHEIKFMGKCGAKGEKRAKRIKATPEQMKKQNQRNKEKYVRRTIDLNFVPYDIWACLKYPKGTRKSTKEVKKDLRDFLGEMRKAYKKEGELLKFIDRLEIGEQGGIHIHMIVNRLRGTVNTDVLMQKLWQHGVVDYKSIYADGGYEKLAAYIVKQPEEEDEAYQQLSLLPKEERREYIRYSSSRNLIRPKPKRRRCSHWTVRKILAEGPKPKKGYYIDKNSIVSGVNPFTGMSYLYYTERRLQEDDIWQQDYGGS